MISLPTHCSRNQSLRVSNAPDVTSTPLSQSDQSHTKYLGQNVTHSKVCLIPVEWHTETSHWDFPMFPKIFENCLLPSSWPTGSLDLWESHRVMGRSRRSVEEPHYQKRLSITTHRPTGSYRSFSNAAKISLWEVMLSNQAHSINTQSYVINMPF